MKSKTGRFDNIKYESMEDKVKWFLPLSFTRKYQMLISFVELFQEMEKNNKKNGTFRKAHRNIQGVKQK